MQRNFRTRTIICLIPILIAIYLVGNAFWKYQQGLGGFKLGTDLAGGTILVYEVDQELSRISGITEGGRAKADNILAESLKRRIDPSDIRNVVIRPLGDTRVEIILPTGTIGKDNSKLTASDVDEIKELVKQVGSLEFRILANNLDDSEGINDAIDFIKNHANKDLLAKNALEGRPPEFRSSRPYLVKANGSTAVEVRYEWVEVGIHYRAEHQLSTAQNRDAIEAEAQNQPIEGKGTAAWREFAKARRDNNGILNFGGGVFYSRKAESSDKQLNEKKVYEYFALTRVSPEDSVKVGGAISVDAYPSQGDGGSPAVGFSFNRRGADQFSIVTGRNTPSSDGFRRQLAILLDGRLISHPTVNSRIGGSGIITGGFTQRDVDQFVNLLRSGALPATLKPQPVSENTIGPTLGADTIRSGTIAIALAFFAVLAFMCFYYRFAGLVATIALFANLILTIGFMVGVNATFTLPGLAGIVLTLGMAVDANVLIYERLREERDRGQNLITALRNGYDRALPTIIDTHLSSIFTAIVLYAVGNDQLKGFGVSLTVGLVISLFTSLYMTRLIFEYWQAKGWLKELRMLRLFSRPNINFMKIRNQMFALTGIITLMGLALFLARGRSGLNVDFIGGTVYGGQLKEAVTIDELRKKLSDESQAQKLDLKSVEEVGEKQNEFVLTYANMNPITVSLANVPAGGTKQAREEEIKRRASKLVDWSVEQEFRGDNLSTTSRYFTIRTTEREPELVRAMITALFGDQLVSTKMTYEKLPNKWVLKFDPPASLSTARTVLEREFRQVLSNDVVAADAFSLVRPQDVEPDQDGRYSQLDLFINKNSENAPYVADNAVDLVLKQTSNNFSATPQAERLETFDGTLASETRNRAFWAILASWMAILLYLWFRFGNWTFGAAAVVCLIHDLCFTLGAIAVCHYLYDVPILGPWLGLKDFKIDLPAVAALLTLVGYSVNDTIVVFDRIKEVRGKAEILTPEMINQSVNQTLSRTILASLTTFLVVFVLYAFGGEGVHLFAFVMVVGVIVGTYSSIYIASPLLLMLGEGRPHSPLTGGGANPAKPVTQNA